MSAVWRCRVCEGVNQGGRTCATCGAVVPVGEPVRAAVRARIPSSEGGPPPPVPPTPRRPALEELPTLEELLFGDPDDLFAPGGRHELTPLPGGCLFAPVPRRRRRRRGWFF